MIEAQHERAKYEAMWRVQDYRRHSPGEQVAAQAAAHFQPVGSVNDYGTGRARRT